MAREMDDSCEGELCFQLRDTKPSGGAIQLMEWSPKMDLLAAALADHSVGRHCTKFYTPHSHHVMHSGGRCVQCDGPSSLCTGNTQPAVVATSLGYSSP